MENINTSVSSPIYKMTIDLNVLDHLGINLYSNIAAVLTEAVANAWDADATEVHITIDLEDGHDLIEISDDGIGMSINDMNTKYLHIGYRRRKTGQDATPGGRPVMGRKGLGKLSLFSIANVIEIQSIKDSEQHGLTLNTDDIRYAVETTKADYCPPPLPLESLNVTKGTIIRLRKIKRKRIVNQMASLRQQVSRRFSVIGEKYNFSVFLNNEPITINDRGELKAAQFVWTFGEEAIEFPSPNNIQKQFVLEQNDESWNSSWKITGWMATSHKPKDLESTAGNLNAIVVLARGRLMQENILDKLNDGRLFTKYLTGQIQADFLDSTPENDIATSDRQRMQEDDPRYQKLLSFLKKQLSIIEHQWSEARKEYEVAKAKEESPALVQWLDGLQPDHKKNAEKVIAKITSLPIENSEDKKDLLRHGIIAFERMKIRGLTDFFAESVLDVEKVISLLSDRDTYEAELYRDIVKSRLEVLKEFCKIVDENAKEKVLQKYLFDHLWLLDPAWERATGSERIEQCLKRDFKAFSNELTEEESKGRLDIRYKTISGKHVIVELKRVQRLLKAPELLEQGGKYRTALEKCLNQQGITNPHIEIVFVLGKLVEEESNPSLGREYVEKVLSSLNARVVYYEEMIGNAQKAYGEYLEHSKKMDTLDAILQNI